MLKVGFTSLGCNKNLVDTEVMMGLLAEAGFKIVEEEKSADILIVNTCGFIDEAKEESINAVLELARYKEEGNCKALIVAGCLAQRYKDELLKEMPEIDGIIGTGEIDKIVQVVRDAAAGMRPELVTDREFIYDHTLPRWQSTPPYTAYVKIAEGCDNRCSYCAIPGIRGGYRSRPKESILQEVNDLVRRGVKEVILIAQDTTRYGTDIYGRYALTELIQEIASLPVHWIRILYAYPTRITDDLIQIIRGEPKVCKYLDMPIQHVDKDIIKAMNRQGDREEIMKLINRLRKEVPGITLRTTLIVGFPGETEAQFQNLLEFVREAKFDRLGVFTYSREESTPAGMLANQVPEEVKIKRRDIIMREQQKISLQKNRQKIGSTILVMVEGISADNPEIYVGRSDADAPEIDGLVYFSGPALNPGDIVQVKITDASEYDLIGEV
ncbi:MiaB-like tRNA modifying enzyme YliG [Thermincola ferriacetica]|uniref:Ribosomal protein uS12 methylthiotransferase RimO n=1 Tax=Thermincola ferriacetica TaxID=281456 RepID=A0A0L6W1T5_9FIRM|nr:30S ribosomal protein S12 methylthiotransferase RimO [Thermincola ferriacetica]KNZ69363.1 MiaB-like tRNA modifying enzyme YliG [Thermincola ferriacetica]